MNGNDWYGIKRNLLNNIYTVYIIRFAFEFDRGLIPHLTNSMNLSVLSLDAISMIRGSSPAPASYGPHKISTLAFIITECVDVSLLCKAVLSFK